MELWFWRKWALNTNTELDKFIRLRAYFLSKQTGDPPGHEKEFYYQAEKEIKEEGIYEKEAKLYKIVWISKYQRGARIYKGLGHSPGPN